MINMQAFGSNYQSCVERKQKVKIQNEILRKINQSKTGKILEELSTFCSPTKLSTTASQKNLQSQYSAIKKSQSNWFTSNLRSASSARKIRVKKVDLKKTRVESLEKIMQKCIDVKSNFDSRRTLRSCQKFNDSAKDLRSSIEKCRNTDALVNMSLSSEKLLRADSKIIRDQLSYTEKLTKRERSVWKFPACGISKKTEKLIAEVANKFKRISLNR